MFLESLNIRGFGCLRTKVDFAPDKVNLAVADNETGKSTLISALLASFYGIVQDMRDRRDKRPHRKNVIPWVNPEEFGLTLDFSTDNRKWRIVRDFATGEVNVIDRETGRDHREEFYRGKENYTIGEDLIGLPVDEFLKSFYLKQEEILEIRESKGLTHYIQGVATALEGGTSSELAIQRLRDARDKYPFENSRDGLKIETAIKRYRDERESSLAEIEKLERARREILPDAESLARIEGEIEALRIEREVASRQGDVAEIRELRQIIDEQVSRKKSLEELKLKVGELKAFEDFPAGRWDQLLTLSTRVEDSSATVRKLEGRLKDEAEPSLATIEKDLQKHRDLAGVTDAEARDLENGLAKLTDRKERLDAANSERLKFEEKLKEAGQDRNVFNRLNEIFNELPTDEKRFIERFRAAYAEEEALYRELKSRREWNERERGLIITRQQKVINTARLFFLIAGMTILSGGLMILLTKGEWLGQVLAGLGVIFGAVGAITRGTAGSADTAALKKLESDLTDVIKGEDESHAKLERIARDLTEIANRHGLEGGHELLAQYFIYDELKEKIEPLLQSEKDFAKAREEFLAALTPVNAFFTRAGDPFPDEASAVETARKLLLRYREVVKLGEDYRLAKAKHGELEADLVRARREFDSNRQLCEEILTLGNVAKREPLADAIADFKERREKHLSYSRIASDELPRLSRELLPEVDVIAKRERLEQLLAKVAGKEGDTPPEHSKEYYRDLAERKSQEEEKLRESRETINRKIVVVFDRYHSQYPELKKRYDELEEKINQAEAFRSEVDVAIQIMTDISKEVYRSWAMALSEEAAPFLESLNPRYSDLQFREDLTFTVRDKSANRTLTSSEVEAILSSGARDEVFLAARLGIACYLSRGAKGAMPIVLDEPLAAVDDEKFVTGMRFFLDHLSKKHQLLIMSCHEERHRWLSGRMPELYGDRVHSLILR